MRSHLIHSETWQNHNERLQSVLWSHFGMMPQSTVRVFTHMESAMYELTQGTSLFYTHKRSLCLQLGSSPLISHFQKLFLREGLQVQVIDQKSFQGDALEQWAIDAKKDTNFCLIQADHPVLDQKIETEAFEKKCEEKKIFCFILHHQTFKQMLATQPIFLKNIRPYSVHLFYADQSADQDLAIAICGERFKTPTLIVDQIESHCFHRQSAELFHFLQQLQKTHQMTTDLEATHKELALSLEQKYPHEMQKTETRQFRQLMLGTKNSADYIYKELLKINQQWQSNLVSPHLCLQNLVTAQFQWWRPMPDLNLLSHLLIVDCDMIHDQVFWAKLAVLDSKVAPSEFEVTLD